MQQLKNENGIALVTALCFTLISLGIIMMLLYSVTQGIKTTTASKRYSNALEASYGTIELLQKDILPQIISLPAASIVTLANSQFSALSMAVPNSVCLEEKLKFSTWDAAKCSASTKTAVSTVSPDMTFNLKATNDVTGYTVYSKIVSTRCSGTATDPCSNSDTGSEAINGLAKPGGTTSTSTPSAPSMPAYYRIELTGQRASNPHEKAELSILYAY